MTAKPPVEDIGIEGVELLHLQEHRDERGRFMETFRREWFPGVNWDNFQTNRSDSEREVLRGLHYHLRQVDYWYVASGAIRVGLADLRPSSPSYQKVEVVTLDGTNPKGLFIPEGVAHGFLATWSRVIHTYIVNQYYDGSDENGVAWNDPDLAIPWRSDKSSLRSWTPNLSPRDQQNPFLRSIPRERLPA